MTRKQTTGGRNGPRSFTETQATRNRAMLAKQESERSGRLLGLFIVECIVLLVIIVVRCA